MFNEILPKNETKNTALKAFLGISLVYLASNFAFTSDIRRLILRRDNYRCVQHGPDCDGSLHASHINHDKNYKGYNEPHNGRTQCVYHHLKYHETTEGRNGLKPHQNSWAVNMLRSILDK